MPIPILVAILRRRRSSPAPAPPDDLLKAVVQYLAGRASVTSLLWSPSAIYTDWAEVGDSVPFLLLEGYAEDQPALSAEDEVAELDVRCYAADLTAVRKILMAVKDCLDSPNLNPNSTLTDAIAWAGGVTTGHVPGRLMMGRKPEPFKANIYVYTGSVEYELYMTPAQ
jgi:hypothetical protein